MPGLSGREPEDRRVRLAQPGPFGDDPPGHLPVQAGVPELALLLRDGAVGDDERHPPGRAGAAQRSDHRIVGNQLPDQAAPQLGQNRALVLRVQPESLRDHPGEPLPGLEPVPVRRHQPRRVPGVAAPGRGEVPRPSLERARPVDQRVVEVNQKQRHAEDPSARAARSRRGRSGAQGRPGRSWLDAPRDGHALAAPAGPVMLRWRCRGTGACSGRGAGRTRAGSRGARRGRARTWRCTGSASGTGARRGRTGPGSRASPGPRARRR